MIAMAFADGSKQVGTDYLLIFWYQIEQLIKVVYLWYIFCPRIINNKQSKGIIFYWPKTFIKNPDSYTITKRPSLTSIHDQWKFP